MSSKMAASIRSQDVREKVIKEGMLRYRQSSLYLQKWKPRYVVFKITHSGRLQLIIYKDQPAIPANEIKEVPIDEFGGLDSNLSLDNEKYAFAIITTHVTESFSAESPHEMTEWTTLLQEYLGKELVLNIQIPSKQNNLKSGRAQLRVRNTGFTITTCENPPRCQGTWQIIHIRKYGGSDSFRFQTGSKCPTGEFLYSIQTDDNARLKNLFNDLSQHRPIFTDDRVGRRMTLERSFNHKVGSHTRVANRYSLQQPSEQEQRLYQNREAFASNNRHNSADIPVEAMGRRHSAVEGDIFNPHAKQPPSEQHSQRSSVGGSPKSAHSNEDLSNRQYQNVQRLPHHGRTSPTKRVQHTVMKAPPPQRYYSVEPPQALKKYRMSTNSTPPSSPDDDGFVRPEEGLGRNTSPDGEQEDYELNEEYVDLVNSELSVRVVGDSLVVHKASPSSQNRSTASISDASHYQNLAFMQGNTRVPPMQPTEETGDSLRKISATSQLSELDDYMEENAHSYTNIEFARESSHGTPRRMKGGFGQGNNRIRSSNPDVSPKKSRKNSAPSGPSQILSKAQISSKESALTSSLELPSPSLRNSHSNYELNKAGIPESPKSSKKSDENQAIFDYYNILVPHLPANSPSSASKASDIGLRNKFTTTSHCHSPNHTTDAMSKRHSYPEENGIDTLPKAQSENVVGYSALETEISALDEVDSAAEPSGRAAAELLSNAPTSKSPRFSPAPSHDGSNPNYDTLVPLSDGYDTPTMSSPQPLYDSLLPKNEAKSLSSSPEPSTYSPNHFNKTYQYNRKVQLLQHGHKYEYIDVELPPSDKVDSHREKEHPSSWVVSPSPPGQDDSAQRSLHSMSARRRKQLPLQDKSIENDNYPTGVDGKDAVNDRGQKSKPQLPHLPRDTSMSDIYCESPKSPRKPHPLPRKGVHSQQSSSELVSSIDSYIARQGVSSVLVHSDSVDSKLYPVKTDGHRARVFSPSHSSTQDVVTPKIKSIQVEIAKEQQEFGLDDTNLPLLPPRQTLKGSDSSHGSESPTQAPALPPRPNPDKKALNGVTSPPSTQRLSEPGIKLPLPPQEIKFHPPVPPRPRVLCPTDNSNQQKYVAVSFNEIPADSSSEYHEVVINPSTTTQPNVPQGQSSSDSTEDRVEYTLVDFNMTIGLGKTIEQVEDRRRGFP